MADGLVWCVFGWVQELLEDGEVKELALLREGGDDVADYLVQESLGTCPIETAIGPVDRLDTERNTMVSKPKNHLPPETRDDLAPLGRLAKRLLHGCVLTLFLLFFACYSGDPEADRPVEGLVVGPVVRHHHQGQTLLQLQRQVRPHTPHTSKTQRFYYLADFEKERPQPS